jgi:Fe-S-cluster containining protein
VANPTFLLPPDARVSCEFCGECCKRWDISFSQRELDGLKSYDWASLFPDLTGRKLFESERRRSWFEPHTYRFALQENDACAFLDQTSNKCRIHARLGSNVKPHVCRQFPFTFMDTSVGTFVGLRFNCPAVLHNRGKRLDGQKDYLQELLATWRSSRPRPTRDAPAATSEIAFIRKQKLWWSEIVEIERYVIRALVARDAVSSRREGESEQLPGRDSISPCSSRTLASLVDRLLLGARVIDLVAVSNLKKIRGDRLKELLVLTWEDLLKQHAEERSGAGCTEGKGSVPAPRRARPLGHAESTVFRQFAGFFYNREYLGEHRKSFFARFKALGFSVLRNNLRFAFGRGELRFKELPAPVDIRTVESFRETDLPPESVELLNRYLLTKLTGKNAVGELFFGQSYTDGYYFLFVLLAAILWYARCSASARGRGRTAHEDVCWAVRYIDFSFGSTYALGSARERVKIFALTLPERARALVSRYATPGAG